MYDVQRAKAQIACTTMQSKEGFLCLSQERGGDDMDLQWSLFVSGEGCGLCIDFGMDVCLLTLFFSRKRNFMGTICLIDKSHEMSFLISSKK